MQNTAKLDWTPANFGYDTISRNVRFNFFRLQCYIWMDGMGWMVTLSHLSSKSTFGANNCMGWSVFTKRGLGARLSCSEEDFATEKCRSIDRLAEKGFCNKSSNKPSLLNRKQFPRASSYIPDTNRCNALPESYYRR